MATPHGDGKFKFVVHASATGDPSTWMIIWNGNGKQTADLTFTMHGLYNFNGCNGTVTTLCDDDTAVENVETVKIAQKVIHNGRLYILHEGIWYDAMGVRVAQ